MRSEVWDQRHRGLFHVWPGRPGGGGPPRAGGGGGGGGTDWTYLSVVIVAVVASEILFVICIMAIIEILPTNHFAVVAGEMHIHQRWSGWQFHCSRY